MEAEVQKKRVAKPLGRSITISCVSFIVILGIALTVISYFNYRRSLYRRYEAYITDILCYVERHIDDDDLAECAVSLQRSEKFNELEKFMDGIKEDFKIHYLYILKPMFKDGKHCIMSIISAENYYDRYIDTEGNLYLGWTSDDEYDEETVKNLISIMRQTEIVYTEENTEWGIDYTGSLPLLDSNKKPYALLCVDVNISEISRLIRVHMIETLVIIFILGFFFTFNFLMWTRISVTNPLKLLEMAVGLFAKTSHGQRDISMLKFNPPELNSKNEVYYLSKAVTQMTQDIRDYVSEIVFAEKKAAEMQKQAAQMNELANKDALTGIRNKTAYDKEIKKLEYDLSTNKISAFGIGMIDLNFLKKINDTYGHEQGNVAIKKLCFLVCTTFEHSPVFRIGGDEFVVVLKGADLENINSLVDSFNKKLAELAGDDKLEPWEKVSAAIGIAFYDKSIDTNVLNVFKRADQNMYECKKAMKATRED
ncbi:GGDEF domain-containing protein [Treponema ruminis]|uniref:diguanylate cyclase n=1 Tax=Treponema ruminis TaxID=744515 RepID=A0A7W8LLQ5_9SPIR|nr:GGDEF domain-containing protein [Treponema ruminis]MBB5225691.1 diguanylate cyclase (GGDEF)-like protein [Treponema ruminis]QSI02380.1 GGDEF domain-containing protein [Treponema ruminis]